MNNFTDILRAIITLYVIYLTLPITFLLLCYYLYRISTDEKEEYKEISENLSKIKRGDYGNIKH